VLGKQVEAQGALFDRIIRTGHAVGNHTWAHQRLPLRTNEDIASTLSATSAVIRQHGYEVRCMRPPYGATDDRVRAVTASVGLSTVLWDMDTFDWKRLGVADILAHFPHHPANKDILMHDGGGERSQTVAAVASILATFADSYRFEPLPECLEAGNAEAVSAPRVATQAIGQGLYFEATTPRRVLDTRPGGVALGAGETRRVQVAERGALAINFTTVQARGAGFQTVWDCRGDTPSTSTNNVTAGQTRAVGTIVGLDDTGTFCIYSSSPADIIVDVTGHFSTKAAWGFHTAPPTRLLDSRNQSSSPGQSWRVATPSGALAVAINLTIVSPQQDGFASAYPCSSRAPDTSTVNYRANENVANFAQLAVGPEGLCVTTNSPAHVIVDLVGWYGAGGGDHLRLGRPVRALDTRIGTGGWQNTVAPDQVITVPAMQGGPARATALITSLTAVNTRSAGFLQAWGCDGARPVTSVLNSPPRATVPNTALLAVVGGGSTCLSMTTRSHLLMDVIAWFEV
jgi:Polysaccharide deacetylase